MFDRVKLIVVGAAVVIALSTLVVPCGAETDAVDPTMRETILKLINAPRVIDIRPSLMDGLYEVVVPGRQILYVHPAKKLVFSGQIFDATTGKSLTAQRAAEVSAAIANDIVKKADMDMAIKVGSGPILLYEFTDLDCSHCRQSEQYFKDKVQVFTRYIYLVAGEKNMKKTKAVLGAENPQAEYLKAMAGDYDTTEPPSRPEAEGRVVKQLQHVKQLMENDAVTGTPTFVWPGGMVEGLDTKFFDKLVELNKQKGDKK